MPYLFMHYVPMYIGRYYCRYIGGHKTNITIEMQWLFIITKSSTIMCVSMYYYYSSTVLCDRLCEQHFCSLRRRRRRRERPPPSPERRKKNAPATQFPPPHTPESVRVWQGRGEQVGSSDQRETQSVDRRISIHSRVGAARRQLSGMSPLHSCVCSINHWCMNVCGT